MVLWGNLKETDSLKTRIKWDDNIKTNLKNTVEGLEGTNLAQDGTKWRAVVKLLL